jgi:hypothetical protein
MPQWLQVDARAAARNKQSPERGSALPECTTVAHPIANTDVATTTTLARAGANDRGCEDGGERQGRAAPQGVAWHARQMERRPGARGARALQDQGLARPGQDGLAGAPRFSPLHTSGVALLLVSCFRDAARVMGGQLQLLRAAKAALLVRLDAEHSPIHHQPTRFPAMQARRATNTVKKTEDIRKQAHAELGMVSTAVPDFLPGLNIGAAAAAVSKEARGLLLASCASRCCEVPAHASVFRLDRALAAVLNMATRKGGTR